jgi:hypothetical protein
MDDTKRQAVADPEVFAEWVSGAGVYAVEGRTRGILPRGMAVLRHSSTDPGGRMPPSTAGRMPAATVQGGGSAEMRLTHSDLIFQACP